MDAKPLPAANSEAPNSGPIASWRAAVIMSASPAHLPAATAAPSLPVTTSPAAGTVTSSSPATHTASGGSSSTAEAARAPVSPPAPGQVFAAQAAAPPQSLHATPELNGEAYHQIQTPPQQQQQQEESQRDADAPDSLVCPPSPPTSATFLRASATQRVGSAGPEQYHHHQPVLQGWLAAAKQASSASTAVTKKRAPPRPTAATPPSQHPHAGSQPPGATSDAPATADAPAMKAAPQLPAPLATADAALAEVFARAHARAAARTAAQLKQDQGGLALQGSMQAPLRISHLPVLQPLAPPPGKHSSGAVSPPGATMGLAAQVSSAVVKGWQPSQAIWFLTVILMVSVVEMPTPRCGDTGMLARTRRACMCT